MSKEFVHFEDKHNFFEKVLIDAVSLLKADEGGVIIKNLETHELRVEKFIGSGVNNKHRILDSDPQASISAYVSITKRLENIPDVRENPRFHSMSETQVLSEIVAPIIYKQKCIGLINLESTKVGAFTKEDEIKLLSYVEKISLEFYIALIESKNYYLAKQSKSIAEITAYTLENAEKIKQDEFLNLILEHTLNLTEADIGGILVLSEDHNYLELKASKGVKNADHEYRIKRGHGICWKAIEENRVLNVWNIQEFKSSYEDISAEKINSELAVPLRFQGRIIGVINVESINYNAFGFEHANILTTFSQQVAILFHLLTTRKKWEGAWAIARWGDLSNNLAHRMNNLIGGVSAISKRIASKSHDSNIIRYAETIEKSTNEALSVLNDYNLRFDWSVEPINVGYTIERAIAAISAPENIAINTVINDSNILIALPKVQFIELIRELISNAIKYMGKSGEITVTVSKQWGVLLLEVLDNGQGFKEQNLNKLLELGERGTSNTTTIGSGYGLWWVKQFINATGGTLNLANHSQGGAKITVTIPIENPY